MILDQENGGRRRILKEDGVFYHVCRVHRSGRAESSRPRIQITGDWLAELGFANGVLVQSMPEPDGIVFNLCDENVHYSALYNETKAKGGTLNRAYISTVKTLKGLTFVTTGHHIYKGGLQFGDALLAKCEYGCIRARKVSGNVRLINVAKTKDDRTKELKPMVLLLGDWLNDIGFLPDTLVTAKPEPDCITFTAWDKAIIYSEVVRFARQNKMRLIQVSTQYCSIEAPEVTMISVTGSCVERAGFALGDIFAAEYEHGVIKLQKLDPGRFGFPEE